MKIAVYGSGDGRIESYAELKARELGKEIARKDCVLVTGGCHGLPQEAVLGAHELRGTCVAFSPAANLGSHVKDYGFPTEGISEWRFIPESYEHINNQTICKQYRCFLSAEDIDGAIIVGGGLGTLLEFTLAHILGKNIGVLENTGGITERVLHTLLQDTHKDTGSEVVFSADPATLVDRLLGSFS